jgi:hypothetical protein
MPRSYGTPLVALVFALVAGGCATAGEPGTFTPRADPNVLTQAEIMASSQGNLADVIRELRPRWLEPRGQQSLGGATIIGVYRDQLYLGGIDVLRNETRGSVNARIEYWDGSTATARLRAPAPGVHLAGAIVIDPRR